MKELLEATDSILSKIDVMERDIEYSQTKILQFEEDLEVLEKKLETIISSEEYHKRAIDILYISSLKEMEILINDVVSAVFFDRNLKVEMELSDSRSKSLSWYVIDLDSDIKMSVKDGIGRGVKTVLSFILQSYYVLSLGSKYLFIDEGYSYISEAYVPKFFEFVKILCEKRGLCLVMISHDDRFSAYADKRYYISDGTISDISKIECEVA